MYTSYSCSGNPNDTMNILGCITNQITIKMNIVFILVLGLLLQFKRVSCRVDGVGNGSELFFDIFPFIGIFIVFYVEHRIDDSCKFIAAICVPATRSEHNMPAEEKEEQTLYFLIWVIQIMKLPNIGFTNRDHVAHHQFVTKNTLNGKSPSDSLVIH